jgi:hypothetical protein
MKRATTFVAPSSGDGGDRTHGMDVHGAIARARKTVSDPEEAARSGPEQRDDVRASNIGVTTATLGSLVFMPGDLIKALLAVLVVQRVEALLTMPRV